MATGQRDFAGPFQGRQKTGPAPAARTPSKFARTRWRLSVKPVQGAISSSTSSGDFSGSLLS